MFDELGVKRLDNVSFTVNAGEVLGVAGVAGSGQRELLESIAGLYPIASGSVTYYDPPTRQNEKSWAWTHGHPQERHCHVLCPGGPAGMGLVGSMGMTGNMMLRSWRKGHGVFLTEGPGGSGPAHLAGAGGRDPQHAFPVRRMSGGNVQKVLVGREIAQAPAVLMTATPSAVWISTHPTPFTTC